MTTLDPRHPLVLDVRELGRRAGAMSRVRTTVPAPRGMGSVGLTVPPGTDLTLDLRLESVVEGVLVSGTATARVEGECSRCLDPVSDEVTADLTELYSYPETDARGRVRRDAGEGPEGDGTGDETGPSLDGDLLDLEPTVRDAVVLALPLAPLCREDCLGLCPQCGARLADDPGHAHDTTDSRWAALAGFAVSRNAEHDEKEEG